MEFNPIGLFLSRRGIVIALIVIILLTVLYDLLTMAGI